MNSGLAVIIYIVSGILSATSQLLLKTDSKRSVSSKGIYKILRTRVMAAYGILLATIFINMIAMRYMDYKYVPILSTLSFVFVIIISIVFMKEKINIIQWVGIVMILLGVVLFSSI